MYEKFGVDPHKDIIKQICKKIIRNDYLGAFVNIIKDRMYPGMVISKHSDGSGSKSVQRYLHYLETGDATTFRHEPYDAFSMNAGDLAASGFVSEYFVTDIMGVNSLNIKKNVVLENIIIGMAEIKSLYKKYGINVEFLGGETADLPDQINSYVLDMDFFSREKEKNIIKGNIEPGDKIFGFSSGGRAVWENEPNSGIMSNGLTMARKGLMHQAYAKQYPFLCHHSKPYQGRFFVDWDVSEKILSPTRQWAIVIKLLIEELKKHKSLHLLHGISMNTGGGATKVKNLGTGIIYTKKMPEPLPIFKLIQKETGEKWENMYTTFNMGVGLDVVGCDKNNILSNALRKVAMRTKVKYFRLGECVGSLNGQNKVILQTQYGEFIY